MSERGEAKGSSSSRAAKGRGRCLVQFAIWRWGKDSSFSRTRVSDARRCRWRWTVKDELERDQRWKKDEWKRSRVDFSTEARDEKERGEGSVRLGGFEVDVMVNAVDDRLLPGTGSPQAVAQQQSTTSGDGEFIDAY
nr:hypothetical protein CFP56_10215 [Quercus suber]